MRKLGVFNFITANGFYKGDQEDISWHRHGQEEGEYAAEGAQSENVLLLGRKTYDMMASFWPTEAAMQQMPDVADGMNKSQKFVFSRTMTSAAWVNTTVINQDIVKFVDVLKKSEGNDITILGSGSIVTQLSEARLIDEYQLMVDPVVLGSGTPLFQGLNAKLDFKLSHSKVFRSGVVLLVYKLQ